MPVDLGKPEWWETEGNKLHYRFEWFRMSSAAPFANGLRDDADWICIARDSLDALLVRLGLRHEAAPSGASYILSRSINRAGGLPFGIRERGNDRRAL